jgi:flagellar hook protein FlgE
LYATRNGAFHLDTAARLVDTNGFRVQGLNNAAQTTTGDITIDVTGDPYTSNSNVTVASFDINVSGEIIVLDSDGNDFIRGQVLLQNFQNLQALVPGPNQLYSNLIAALPMHAIGLPGAQGLGFIESNALEMPAIIPTLQLPPQTGFRLLVSNLVPTGTVQSSSDLHSWTTLGQVFGSVMYDAQFFDTNTPASPAQFYRVRLSGF